MLLLLISVCVMTSGLGDAEQTESRVVKIKQGPVRGYLSPDGDFYEFNSVPYATAPTGPHRFKGPQPPPVWVDTFDAIERNIICPQFEMSGFILDGKQVIKEDCLVANIYVPKTKEEDLPVLVYVHGGAYFLGYSNLLKPRHLAKTKRAIIVNFNYRLGAHGFLCLGTKDIPGNAGMKDQVALLRWVKDNIASFGGNPDDVTLAGYSAGSSAADLLQISKMTDNLFTKVIPESGANVAAFSVQSDPIRIAKNYARQLNFTNVDDIYALEEFYKSISHELLTSINMIGETDSTFVFSPCVERDTGVERFLDDDPVSIMRSGKYEKRSMLYGFANMEGLFRMNYFENWKNLMNRKFSDFLPADLQFETEEEKEKVAALVKKFYFRDKPVGTDNVLAYVDFFSDVIFAYPTLRSVKLQVEAGNDQIYLYEYAFVNDDSVVVPHTNVRGAYHGAQSIAIHDGVNLTQHDESLLSDDMKHMKKTLREMWLNFVETGKPVPEGSPLPAWPPTGADGSPYMLLQKDSELKMTPLLEKRAQFWNKIYDEYYRYPISPSSPPTLHSDL